MIRKRPGSDKIANLPIARGAIFLIFLAACSPLLNFTPERAAAQAALGNNSADLRVDVNSILALQNQAWGNDRLVLVTFQGLRPNNQVNKCLFIYEVKGANLGWSAGSGGGGCVPPDNSKDPLEGFAGSLGQDNQFTSYTYGWINQADISAVDVNWEDGEIQRVNAVNRSYLAVRDGNHSYTSLQGLNANGQPVCTVESPGSASGKGS
jgi:hypothetical protein